MLRWVEGMVSEEMRRGPPAGVQFPDLVGGLKAAPGCLGVETARTAGGKEVIFAWFQHKAAVLDWYYSDMHRLIQDRIFFERPVHKPLDGVPDDGGPIMVIASLTLAEGMPLPFSQISIEPYKPITGGIFIGGRFAPEAFQVPGMMDYAPGPP